MRREWNLEENAVLPLTRINGSIFHIQKAVVSGYVRLCQNKDVIPFDFKVSEDILF